MSTFCLYHDDADGRASAAIVRRVLGKDVTLHAINYGDPIPWEKVLAAEHVIVVDFSLPAEDMQRLADSGELTWIDHHISAIEQLKPISGGWPGIRSTAEAGCVLAWRYFYPELPVPRGIVLIGDRDAWLWREKDTGAFDEGLNQENTRPENDALWQPLLDDNQALVTSMIQEGETLRRARLKSIHRIVDRYGYPVMFEGFRTLAINRRGNGDMGSYIQKLGYQIAYCYVDDCQSGHLMTAVSLYSSDVDVSVLARKFGGGGHRGASGFAFERSASPFPPKAQVHHLEPEGS